MLQTLGEPKATGIQTPRNRTPRGRDASKERSLAKVTEAYHSALAVTAALEGGNRMAQLPPHLELIQNMDPFLQQGPPQT